MVTWVQHYTGVGLLFKLIFIFGNCNTKVMTFTCNYIKDVSDCCLPSLQERTWDPLKHMENGKERVRHQVIIITSHYSCHNISICGNIMPST